MAKRMDPAALKSIVGTLYPSPYDEPCRARERTRLGDAAGLTQFGVNLLRLPPGVWSSQRHWHTTEDEFVYVLSGEVTLVTDSGEEVLRAGDCAGFKANDSDGHCLQNRSGRDATVLEIGTRDPMNNMAYYSDIDMMAKSGGYAHRDGTPYPKAARRGP
ncbi:MAG: cupin domain-containing protein [Alphaproteobacteria bacterium]|nr:cupin domain-containing protein [Alphaproteobacteria bacterium]